MIVRIASEESYGDYDLFVDAPEGVAVEQIDKIIRDVKEADPDGYTAGDLLARLAEIGVERVEIVDAGEDW